MSYEPDIEAILKTLRHEKPQLQQRYGVSMLGVFGSTARGEAEEDSDIDILVDFSKPIGLEFVDLATDLETLLGYPVDLVPRDAIRPRFWPFIEADIRYV